MSWTLETAKQYLGIDPGDTSQDVVIQSTLDYVLSAVESILQRGLLFTRETVAFHHVTRRRILLPRYPVSEVHDMSTPDNMLFSSNPILHKAVGWLEDDGFCGLTSLSIEYSGGFVELPIDLERTLWEIFMSAWSRTDESTGAPSSSSGAAGEVKDITVPDAFKITYNVGETSTGEASAKADYGWLAPWASVLSIYRSEYGAGLGVA